MPMPFLLLLAACAGPTPLGLVSAKAPSGEYCDGEDNDGDSAIDEGCGACDMLYTRVRSWWQAAECVVEGEGTGRELLPISVGSNTYATWATLSSFLGAPGATDKQRLGQQLLVARLNEKAFGIGGIAYHDWDGDGELESVSALLDLADGVFSGPDAAAQVSMFAILAALNSEGNGLTVYIDQNCARDAEYCDGADNDGDGAVDESCGCVEACDGVDNDADGTVDEEGPDNDSDGYQCDDCDDNRSRTNPGAYEVPQNAIDDDCDGSDATYTYDFDTDVQPLFDSYCVSCHAGAGASAGLDLSPEVSYTNLVGVASTQLASYVLVQPASTAQSYLYRKVVGTQTTIGGTGGRMPLGGPYLSLAQAGILGTWITEGAPPSCDDGDGDGWTCTDCDDADPTVYPGASEVRGDERDQDCDGADLLYTYGLAGDIQPLFTASCIGCHGASLAYLGLRLDDGYTRGETVDIPASQLASMDLIEPGDYTRSYLYHKLAGSHRTIGGSGNRMPQGGPYWLAEVLDIVEIWIDEGAPSVACADDDGDIYSCSDCDDVDSAVFPGAAEGCNGVDDDCDGQVDEGLLLTWFADLDGDTYGDPAVSVEACVAPDGYVANDEDCADDDATAWPGAPEVCDGMDQDCDGAVDDDAGDLRTWYLDADQDGFGDDATSAQACTAPLGYSGVAGDCDDTLAHVNPDATEVCADTFDNDCSGDAPDCFLSGNYDATEANAWFWGSANDLLGHDLARAGDTDGDGQDSFWVASAWVDTPYANAGAVYLVGGAADLHGVGTVGSFADVTLSGEAAQDGGSGSVDGDADIDGDGLPDAIIGASGNDRGGSNAGTAYVFLAPFPTTASLSTADALYTGDTANDQAAYASALVPDHDGLGGVALAIAGIGDSAGGSGAGALWVVDSLGTGVTSLSTATAKFVGENASDQAGCAVARLGDFDGDGLSDVALGAHQNDAAGSNAGATYILLAPFSGTVDLSVADRKLTGEAAGDIAGFMIGAADDVDGDGRGDLYIGAPNADSNFTDGGSVYLVLGETGSGTASLSTADAEYTGIGSSTQLGVSAASAGDVNGDGVPDFIGGGRSWNDGAAAVGAAWVIFQPALGTVSVSGADIRVGGEASGDSFGDRATGIGDVDSDGFDDLAINATNGDAGASNGGTVYVFLSPGF